MDVITKEKNDEYQLIEVSLTAEETAEYLATFYLNMAHSAGLKPSKTLSTRQLVEEELGLDVVGRAASQVVVMAATPLAFDIAKIHAVGIPNYGCYGYAQSGSAFSFEIRATIMPKIDLLDYSSVQIPLVSISPSNQEIDDYLNSAVQFYDKGISGDSEKTGIDDIDDAWVERFVGDCSTVVEFREKARAELEEQGRKKSDEFLRYLAVSQIADRLADPVPDTAFAAFYAQVVQEFERDLIEQGISKEDYIEQNSLSEESLKSQLLNQTRLRLRQMIALDAVARHKNISLSSGEFAGYLDGLGQGSSNSILDYFRKNGGRVDAQDAGLRFKVNEWLVQNAEYIDA